jgi:hypothetical protein
VKATGAIQCQTFGLLSRANGKSTIARVAGEGGPCDSRYNSATIQAKKRKELQDQPK